MTAGSGIEGDGDTERRIDWEDPNDERLLWVVGGGFIGRASDTGVPGADGTGEPIEIGCSCLAGSTRCALPAKSGGAGLDEDIRLEGKSILAVLPCCAKENCPSFVFKV